MVDEQCPYREHGGSKAAGAIVDLRQTVVVAMTCRLKETLHILQQFIRMSARYRLVQMALRVKSAELRTLPVNGFPTLVI